LYFLLGVLGAGVLGMGDVGEYLGKPVGWWEGQEAKELGDRVLLWQTDEGWWPKNVDTSAERVASGVERLRGTFDNGAGRDEMRFLGRLYGVTGEERYARAFSRGLVCVLGSQYENGGWPQSPDPGAGYGRHITFNDGTMIGLMELLGEVREREEYGFVGEECRGEIGEALARGLECILRCQVREAGELTVWCAQHDRESLEPVGARSYELASLSGGESAGVLLYLMERGPRTEAVCAAVEAGVLWYARAKISGWRQVVLDGDKRLVADAAAPGIWARFYELGSGRPFFCGRDGVKRYALSEIEAERRNGYAWYGGWGREVMAGYVCWTKRVKEGE
jgi:PelA/Pel-15E family pectate lyase